MNHQFGDETIDFVSLEEGEISKKLKDYNIALTFEEGRKIQQDFLGRAPYISECVLWSIQGSEHCSYKSSRLFLNQYITDGPNVILGPTEDAGIIEIAKDKNGGKYGLVISHESHNHPSQIVPYEGAATGIGGNVRDVSCMGAKVIAGADALRFGEIEKQKTKYIQNEVVKGIAGYGNPIGVPIIAGDTYFNKGYNDNCLVNVVHLGVLKEDEIIHSKAPKNADGYDLILVGKATDNTGFGGAQFASLELEEDKKEQNKGAVQEPNAFLKKHLLKATHTLVKKLKKLNLLNRVGLKDLGAGGISCAAVELADSAGYGVEVDMDKVQFGMEGLHPTVALCSETQERYMWVACPIATPIILEHYNKIFELPKMAKNAKATVIGKIKNGGQFVVKHKGRDIINAKASDITKGLLYERKYKKPEFTLKKPKIKNEGGLNQIFLKILSHENIASKKVIYERYDKQVQGATVVEPGEADAGVVQPFLDTDFPDEIKNVGVALSVDHNPRFGLIDSYWGAVNAVAEAMRNVTAVGAVPQAITNCLNYGNPEKEEQMFQFVEGIKGIARTCKNIHLKNHPNSPIPIISGNVSLYNESDDGAIPPSPVIACVGKIEDVSKVIKMSFKKTGSKIFMVGKRREECGGSVYFDIFGELGAIVPKVNFKELENQIFAMTDAIEGRLILSAHDISDGGIAIALAEMTFQNEIGCEVEIKSDFSSDRILFGETGGFVIEVSEENEKQLKEIFTERNTGLFEIGKTIKRKRILINKKIEIELESAKNAWENGLRSKL
ncbi:MAG: phosphoribosylformylglycinamidine synthase subunit PurL [Candidatus Magasanikbacteria bacterium]|nr:phosphoribosylformylglycinamidine synthase subunit PurL [Candidatus Magasanikbacteria bacterium]